MFVGHETCEVCGEPCKRADVPEGENVVYVGDGYSDRCAAQAADRIFARDGLATYLDEQGVEYEVVKGPLRSGKRDDLAQVSGQRKYPAIEFEDGSAYRAESAEMAERIRAGELFSESGGAEGSAPTSA